MQTLIYIYVVCILTHIYVGLYIKVILRRILNILKIYTLMIYIYILHTLIIIIITDSCFYTLYIKQSVIKTVDVSYGGESGFNQAIELSAETLGAVKLVCIYL